MIDDQKKKPEDSHSDSDPSTQESDFAKGADTYHSVKNAAQRAFICIVIILHVLK